MRAFVLDGYGAIADHVRLEGGAIRPVIDREFAFEQLPDALTYLEAGRARGKVVLKVR